MDVFEELRGDLCFAQFEEEDFSSHKLENIVGELENPFGILKFVRKLKDEGTQLYKQSNMVLAIAKYTFALKILSFVLVCNDDDKSVFSSLAVSLNLNLGECYAKERNFDKVGQLCSAVLCYDNSNVKAYFRIAVASLELNKPDLAFMDLSQAIRIDPNSKEFQQKLKEVTCRLGWSQNFVDDALVVTTEDERFRDFVQLGKEEEKRKLGKKGKRKEGDGHENGCVRRCIGVNYDTKVKKNVVGKSLDLEGKVNPSDQDERPNVIDNISVLKSISEEKKPNLTGSSYRFSNQKRTDSYLHLTPTMYGAASKGRTLLFYCSSRKNFISIRVLDPPKKKDSVETQKVSTLMEISHPPLEGHDRCEKTPILMQEDPTIGIVTYASSRESMSMLLPRCTRPVPVEVYYDPQTVLLSNVEDICLFPPLHS